MQIVGNKNGLLLFKLWTETGVVMSRKKITEVAEVERAVKGKIYPAGCTLIALSATKPEPEYAPDSGEIDTRYAVIMPKRIESEYLFEAVKWEMPEFLHKHRTGINLQFSELKHMKVVVIGKQDQLAWVSAIKKLNDQINETGQEIEVLKDMKKFHLDGMFPK